MVLNKQKGNMYGFVTHTWNPIKGKCSHDCSYCYMKRWGEQKGLSMSQKELHNLGKDNFIFVGSSTDMFADDVPTDWIIEVLDHCGKYNNNKYLFQTKNPKRFNEFLKEFPEGSILCITLESDYIKDGIHKAPLPIERAISFRDLDWNENSKMITIEPIIKFNYFALLSWIEGINPFQVNIGADSQRHNLKEPSKGEVEKLIFELKKFTNVFEKDNLKRLLKRSSDEPRVNK